MILSNQMQILSFNKDWSFYYQLFNKFMEKGDYSRAIFYLKNAIDRNNSDESLKVELARIYTLAERYELSNRVYFNLLSEGKSEDKCFFGLSQNLYYLNDMERSIYYLNMYMDKYSKSAPIWDEYEEEYIEIVDEEDYTSEYGIIYPPEKRDMTEYIEQAKESMKMGHFEEAANSLKKVVKGNNNYISARNNLALCCFFMGDYNATRQYSEEVLTIEKNNIFALCNLCAMYGYVGHTDKSDEYLKKIIALEVTEIGDLYKIATTLCELKEHELALKYLKRILKVKQFDYHIMFLTAIAYYNTKNINRAEDIFIQLLHFDENDYAVKYYLKFITTVKAENDFEKGFFQPLEYLCQVPYGEMIDRIKKLKSLLKKTPAMIKKTLSTANNDFMELCGWSFTLADIELQKKVINLLIALKLKESEKILSDKLLDSNILFAVKKLIIEQFMLKKIDPPYNVLIDYSVKKLTPIITEFLPEEKAVYTAYCYAYISSLQFSSEKIESDLFLAYKKVLKAIRNKDFGYKPPNKKVLSAVIVLMSKSIKSKAMIKRISMLFLISAKKLENSLIELGFLNKVFDV